MKKIVVVAPKPYVARAAIPHILTDPAGCDISIISFGGHGLFERRMPRGLQMSAYPHIQTPTWSVRTEGRVPVNAWRTGTAEHVEDYPFDAIREADRVVCMADETPQDVLAVAMLLTHAAGYRIDEKTTPRTGRMKPQRISGYSWLESMDDPSDPTDEPYAEHEWIALTGTTQEALLAAHAKKSTTWSPSFRSLVAQGCALRFFFNAFDVNATAILSPVIRSTSSGRVDDRIDAIGLQFLFRLVEKGPVRQEEALVEMREWKGTGKYDPMSLGPVDKILASMERLVKSGLAERKDGLLGATRSGIEFVTKMHKDCRDPDQLARVAEWSQNWPGSRPVIERYLNRFFGRQKRLSAGIRT